MARCPDEHITTASRRNPEPSHEVLSHTGQIRPYLFLDIDGPLNPSQPKLMKHWGFDVRKHDLVIADGRTLRVWAPTRLAEALVALPVDIVWATTWVTSPTDLAAYAALLGLPPTLPAVSADLVVPAHTSLYCGKQAAIADYLDRHGPRPFVWIDDYLGISDRSWLADLGIAHLAIKPAPTVGITRADLAAIGTWLADDAVGA